MSKKPTNDEPTDAAAPMTEAEFIDAEVEESMAEYREMKLPPAVLQEMERMLRFALEESPRGQQLVKAVHGRIVDKSLSRVKGGAGEAAPAAKKTGKKR